MLRARHHSAPDFDDRLLIDGVTVALVVFIAPASNAVRTRRRRRHDSLSCPTVLLLFFRCLFSSGGLCLWEDLTSDVDVYTIRWYRLLRGYIDAFLISDESFDSFMIEYDH